MPGLDEELNINEKVTEFPEQGAAKEDKPKRKPFHYWTVGGTEHKMKLTTSMITKLENKYRCNLVTLIADGDTPPLSVMLTVTQAAIAPWEHKVSYSDVEKIYDRYIEDGGNMSDFYNTVIMPTMAVSGFFTESITELIYSELKSEQMLG